MSEIRMEKRLPPEAPSRKQALKLFVLAAAGLFAMSFLGALLPRGDVHVRALVLNLFYYLLFLGLPCWLCLRKKPAAARALRPNPLSFSSALFIVVIALLCVFFVNDIVILWSIPFQKLGFNVHAVGMELPATRSALLMCILYGAVLPGIFEEISFRGMLLPAFEQQGTRRAIRISALLFALLHGSVIGFPAQLMLGMVIAELVICCDSIYAGLIFHTAYNAAAMIIQYWQLASDPSLSAPAGDYFTLVGGWNGVTMLLVSILFSAAMLRFSLRAFKMRAMLSKLPVYPVQKGIRWERGEKLLLAAGLALAALLFALDIIAMLTM